VDIGSVNKLHFSGSLVVISCCLGVCDYSPNAGENKAEFGRYTHRNASIPDFEWAFLKEVITSLSRTDFDFDLVHARHAPGETFITSTN
jgi:hypothetical protein